MLELKGASVTSGSSHEQVITSNYEAIHMQVGRGGTCLKLSLSIERSKLFNRVKASFSDLAPEVEGDDAEAALDKLADWCERASIAIRERGKAVPAISKYEPHDH